LEQLIEVRNNVSYRLVEAEANLNYWRMVVGKLKSNTQKTMDATNKIQINQKKIKLDKAFLKIIDSMIRKLTKKE